MQRDPSETHARSSGPSPTIHAKCRSLRQDQHQHGHRQGAREPEALLEEAVRDLSASSPGRKPSSRKARQVRSRSSTCARDIRSVAGSRCADQRMWEFLDRLDQSFAIPRIRDFRGLQGQARRARQLFAGPHGPVDLPRGGHRQDREHAGNDDHDQHDRGRDDVSKRLLEELGVPFKRKDEEK